MNINNEYYLSQNKISPDIWIFEKPEISTLKEKIYSNGTSIKNISDIKLNRGITTGLNKAFIIDEYIFKNLIKQDKNNEKIIKPVLRGKDFDKWKINYQNKYIICTKNGIDVKKEYPVIYNYLSNFENKLSKRYDQGNHWSNLRNCTYYNDFENKKIISQRVCKHPNFSLSNNKEYLLDSSIFIILNNENKYILEYLLMILNSNITEWYLKRIGHKLGTTGFLLSNQYMNQLIIPKLTLNEQKNIKTKVLELIKLKENEIHNQTKIKIIEKEFNEITYNLFNLTESEKQLIENDLK